MPLLKEFIKYIQQENLFQKNDYLLLAVSGGVDSVVLCELCKQANFHFEIAHCNFQLRGEESERDEKFARSFAKKYGVKIFVKTTFRFLEKWKLHEKLHAILLHEKRVNNFRTPCNSKNFLTKDFFIAAK